MNFSSRLEKLEKSIGKAVVRKDLLKEEIEDLNKKITRLQNRTEKAKQARVLIQHIAQVTQRNLESRLSDIVTLALASIFPDPYRFITRFDIQRNKTEANFLFEKNGRELSPLDESEYGAANVAALMLHLGLFTLKPTRPVLVADEPLKELSIDYQPEASETLKMISNETGVQLIIVSHNPEIIRAADNVLDIETLSKTERKMELRRKFTRKLQMSAND